MVNSYLINALMITIIVILIIVVIVLMYECIVRIVRFVKHRNEHQEGLLKTVNFNLTTCQMDIYEFRHRIQNLEEQIKNKEDKKNVKKKKRN